MILKLWPEYPVQHVEGLFISLTWRLSVENPIRNCFSLFRRNQVAVGFVGGGEATWWVCGAQVTDRAGVVLTVELSSTSSHWEGGLFPGDGIALRVAFRK